MVLAKGDMAMKNMKKFRLFALRTLMITLPLLLYGCETNEVDDSQSKYQTYESALEANNALENEYSQINLDENDWPPKGDDHIIMRVGIFRAPHETYYFTLSQNGILEASWGNSLHNTPFEEMELFEIEENSQGLRRRIIAPRYYHRFDEDLVDMLGVVEEIGTYQLARADFYNLIEMLERVKNIPDDRALGAVAFGNEIYRISLNYNNTFFQFMYGGPPLTERDVVEAFVEMLLWHSPAQTPDFWGARRRAIEAGIRPIDRWIRGTPQG